MNEPDSTLAKEVPHANLIIGALVACVVLAFTFLAGSHHATNQFYAEQQAISSLKSDKKAAQGQKPAQKPIKSQAQTLQATSGTGSLLTLNANGRTRVVPTRLNTNLLNLDIHWINPNFPVQGPGGAIAHYGNSILVAKPAVGSIYRFNQDNSEFYQLRFFLPITNQFKLPASTIDGRKITPLRYNGFGVFEQNGDEHIIAFHGYYNVEEDCRTVRVSQAKLPTDWLQPPTQSSGIELEWQTLFEAEPCLSFTAPKEHVTGYQEGGALLIRGNDVYFTTGDMGRDGLANRKPVLTQTESSDFGRMFHLDLDSGDISRVAMGLRNTPSLTLAGNDRIWGVDIGPQGGDELNLLDGAAGMDEKNYGWPNATFGVDYTGTDTDLRRWPYAEVLGRHDGQDGDFEKPIFHWPVAVTPGGITYVEDFHPSWDGNLIIAALTRHALLRLIMEDDRVVGQEIMPLPARMKSVLNAHNRLYFLTDAGWLGYLTPRDQNPTLSPERIAANQVLERAGCAECHSNQAIPSLSGIWNANIASQTGKNYSQALRQVGGKWNSESLAAYLRDPQTFAPGSMMPNPQLNEAQLNRVIKALTVAD